MRRKLSLGILLLIDTAIVSLTPLLALMIRFEETAFDALFITFLFPLMPVIIFARLITFYAFGLYHRLWRYASINELLAIGTAVTLSSVIIVTYTSFIGPDIPKSVHFISWFSAIILIGLSRLCVRIISHMRQIKGKKDTSNVLIIGAGDAGAMIAREIKYRYNGNKIIIGFIDDDPYKYNQMIFGVKIIGNRSVIRQTVREYQVNEIIIAMPSIGGNIVREILSECRQTACTVKTLPGMYELIDGKVTVQQLRDVNLEDLLRRDPVQLDLSEITGLISGRNVLVTGAGGSIGSELCRQIAKLAPKKLVLLGKGENSIYEIDRELRMKFPNIDIRPIIADVRDRKRINKVFVANKPQVVFHAAAHKHVPLMELQPEEAVRNNIFGTKVVAEAADRARSEVFVMVSTDKAVNPSSIMGATKRVAELVIQSVSKLSDTKFVAVRFGNVLGSRGSVIPLFKTQIAAGGPITITHPDMERYFMTIPEAVQLVLQAGSMARGGEVFVLDMGKPVKIVDLAHDLIELSGLVPYEDIKIEYTGTRPGEKLFEELLTAEEGIDATKHEKIFIANIRTIDDKQFQQWLTALRQAIQDDDVVEIIKRMVPTYSAGSSSNRKQVNNQDSETKVKNKEYTGGYQTATGLIH
ncbi:polysaccharide biosynthesis protein [Sporomusa malonica]|uniref:NDP-sugar epimerase, includes UDP-GlcNAc-inverting 4,6-dehydratase FlaA1 and capsular polysaccharide biosynthesis protein EpsC n=1 Tax=Sporomusa malonica TaxID=112901 RepID=A0A1W2DKE4_9FIRM|nr:nucleoside-diphosphate sugar epimerase/dehydratase [Sporomusa malonica]SMC97964.1 NDP-sugar epimerase, includes UDP-GlcNAc-inverting 4,6-dehydratase FlaA1 and capsular polysaccharide biosynthesis protein EpsC [Sporomusa malonica]